VKTARSGVDEARLDIVIYQRDGSVWNMQFDELWRMLSYGQ
jgi:hypothetical protein